MHIRSSLRIALELGKIRISLPVAFSALAGYVFLNGSIDMAGLILAAGVLFISCGSSVINHIQEWRTDMLMPRTRNRPLPSGRISVAGAYIYAIVFIIAGSLLLLTWFPLAASVLSWITLAWYNLVYTPLKKVTAFAVVPGSVTGALPPFIGWLAAGGHFWDMQIILVGAFFFIGQIPHFWLLLLMFGDQYSAAGMPSLNKIFNSLQIKRISFVWILTTIASALLVTGFVISSNILVGIILLYIFYLLWSLVYRFLIQNEFHPLPMFYRLNILYLMMMVLLIAEGYLRN
jgi:heme o synthase